MSYFKNHIILIGFIAILFINNIVIAQQSERLVWPVPPNEPKIEYLSSFSNSIDIGVKKSFLRKMWDRFAGNDALEEMLIQPIGITGDKDGNIYVADPGANCVHIFNRTQKTYSQIRGRKGKALKSPVGVAVSDSGLVYISDSELGEIQVFNIDGDYQFTIKGYFQQPTGININQNALYVTDTGSHKIFIFNLDGVYLFEFGNPGTKWGEFNRPIFITKGSLFYVTDAMNFRVQVLDEGFNSLFTIGYQGDVQGTFARPKGVAVDSDENIYIVDGLFDAVQIFDYKGDLLLVFGKGGNGRGEFDMPAGIYIDNNDYIYVVDTLNSRVQVFKYLK